MNKQTLFFVGIALGAVVSIGTIGTITSKEKTESKVATQPIESRIPPTIPFTAIDHQPEPRRQSPAPKSAYDIQWKFRSYDFGELQQNTKADSVVFEFIVQSGVAQMTGSKTNCGCTMGEWKPLIHHEGEKGQVTIKYDTKRIGRFNKTFEVFFNRNSEPETLTITGIVVDEKNN